jgi:DNA primase
MSAELTIAPWDPVVPTAWSAVAWARLRTAPPFTTATYTVWYLDLDGLKAVNDTAGHAAGDERLKGLGVMVRHLIRPDDVLVRLGGDEFAILATPPVPDPVAQALADRLMQTAALAHLPCSVGWAQQTTTLAAALDAADHAMLAVKQRRKALAAATPKKARRGRSPAAREAATALIHQAKDAAPITSVIGATVALKRVGSVWMGRCPFHDDTHPSLAVYADGRDPHWHCFGCPPPDNHGDVIDWVQRQQGGTRRQAAEYLLATHWPAALQAPAPASDPYGYAKADPKVIAVYHDLWPRLTLTPAHRAWLRGRGLTEAAIAAHGFKSLPADRAGWPTRLRRPDEITRDLTGVPGFSQARGGWLHGAPGILLPVRDAAGQVVGAQIRPDDIRGAKYLWWSTPPDRRGADGTALFPGGAAAAAHATWATPGAQPVDLDAPLPEIWVTEGVLKAIVAAEYLGVSVWGVPGIGQWAMVLWDVALGPPASLVVAFDQDPPGSTAAQAVARATDSLIRAVAAAYPALLDDGRIGRAAWPPEYKGLDDALVAGVWPTVTPVTRADLTT